MAWTRFAKVVRLVLIAMTVCWAADQVVRAQSNGKVDQNGMPKMRNTTQAQRKAAAKNKKKAGLRRLGTPAKGAKGKAAGASALAATPFAATALAAATAAPTPGGTPDYFGPYSNWANSPLPQGPVNPVVTITSPGGGYTAPPLVTISDVYGIGSGATATATVDAFGQVASITVLNTQQHLYAAPVVMIDPPPCTFAGCEVATASATIAGATSYVGGLQKFIDTLPNLTVATPDIVTYPGTDYYEIELVEYADWKFHTNLDPTTLRGYHQTNNGTDTAGCPPAGCTAADNTVAPPAVSYLGPAIVAQKDRPTRIKFTNNLADGSRRRPLHPRGHDRHGGGIRIRPGQQDDGYLPAEPRHAPSARRLHAVGQRRHAAPVGDPCRRRRGPSRRVSAPSPSPTWICRSGNSMTFYWTNQQSGRLMFYHDHAYGITRLNVYAGEAAGYLLVDPVERKLTDGTTSTIPADGRRSPGHPGQDVRVGHARRRGRRPAPGPPTRRGTGDRPQAASGSRTSTCRTRTRGTSAARTRWADGTTRCGSGRPTRA